MLFRELLISCVPVVGASGLLFQRDMKGCEEFVTSSSEKDQSRTADYLNDFPLITLRESFTFAPHPFIFQAIKYPRMRGLLLTSELSGLFIPLRLQSNPSLEGTLPPQLR
jgi:hypothetical protein